MVKLELVPKLLKAAKRLLAELESLMSLYEKEVNIQKQLLLEIEINKRDKMLKKLLNHPIFQELDEKFLDRIANYFESDMFQKQMKYVKKYEKLLMKALKRAKTTEEQILFENLLRHNEDFRERALAYKSMIEPYIGQAMVKRAKKKKGGKGVQES